MQRSTRIIPASRRFLSVPPTGRPATTDKTTNLGRQTPGGYGGSGGPIPQGTGPAPPQPPKKSNVGFIVGAIALVAGSGAYYLTLDDPKKEVAHDLSALKKGAEHEVDAFRAGGARSTSEQLGPTAGAGAREAARYADNLRSPDQRYGAEQVKDALHRDAHAAENAGRGVADEVKQWGNKLAGDARAATDRAERAGHGFKDEVHRWGDALSSGPRERDAWKPTLDELKRYRDLLRGPDREYGYEQVEKALKGNGVDVTTVGRNPYLDWVGPGHHLRRGTVERKLRDLEREVRLPRSLSRFPHVQSADDRVRAHRASRRSTTRLSRSRTSTSAPSRPPPTLATRSSPRRRAGSTGARARLSRPRTRPRRSSSARSRPRARRPRRGRRGRPPRRTRPSRRSRPGPRRPSRRSPPRRSRPSRRHRPPRARPRPRARAGGTGAATRRPMRRTGSRAGSSPPRRASSTARRRRSRRRRSSERARGRAGGQTARWMTACSCDPPSSTFKQSIHECKD